MIFLKKILLVTSLYYIIIRECLCQNNSTTCEGEDKIYIQWYSLYSGWYYLNRTDWDESYIRYPPASFSPQSSLDHFEFYFDEGTWYLDQWLKNYDKINLKSIEYNNTITPYGIGLYGRELPCPINFQELETATINPLAKLERNFTKSIQKTTSEPDYKLNSTRKRQKNNNSSATVPEKSEEKKRLFPNNHSAMRRKCRKRKLETNDKEKFIRRKSKRETDFKVYCPKRCKCKTAYVDKFREEFKRIDQVSLKTYIKCRKMLLPPMTKEEMSSINDTTKYAEEDRKFFETMWRPQYFVSDSCAFLKYDSTYDNWYIDFEWDDCNDEPQELLTFVSEDSAPCLEYLPRPKNQKWKNPKFVCNSTNDSINWCNRNFRMKRSNFSVRCSSMDD